MVEFIPQSCFFCLFSSVWTKFGCVPATRTAAVSSFIINILWLLQGIRGSHLLCCMDYYLLMRDRYNFRLISLFSRGNKAWQVQFIDVHGFITEAHWEVVGGVCMHAESWLYQTLKWMLVFCNRKILAGNAEGWEEMYIVNLPFSSVMKNVSLISFSLQMAIRREESKRSDRRWWGRCASLSRKKWTLLWEVSESITICMGVYKIFLGNNMY